MRIAVFHNFLDNIGGAEVVCLTLARELNADIYTTNVDAGKIRLMGFGDVLPRIRSIGKVPINAPWRQQLVLARFRRLNLKGKYDFFIIGGDWAVSAAVNNKPNIWYVHSPIREIWDLHKYVRGKIARWWQRVPFDVWVFVNRYLNRKYTSHVGSIVCNSINTQKRVEKYLKRNAKVINPPIETRNFKSGKKGDYWLSVNRLVAHKRIGLQLRAFSKLPNEKLIIVGSYEQSDHFLEYKRYCEKIKPSNVEILSWVDSVRLAELYSNCKGFLITSKEEDFGMAPLEAMASGKAVIAPNEGGYKETVIDGKTGILIDEINEDKLANSVIELGKKIEKDKGKLMKDCLAQAIKFDTRVFIDKIRREFYLK